MFCIGSEICGTAATWSRPAFWGALLLCGLSLVLPLFFVFPASASAGEIHASGSINSSGVVQRATVFLNGAEITRVMSVKLKPGKNSVTFAGLPADVRSESIAASAGGGARLISAAFKVNHMESPEGVERVRKLNEEYRDIEERIARNAARISVMEAEEDFLRQNRAIAGKNGINLEELRDVSGYYRSRLSDIAEEKIDTNYRQEELQKRLDRLAQQLGGMVDDGRRAVGEITVEMSSETEETVPVEVSYFAGSAGWQPYYEIRAEDTEGPVRFVGKGRIYQATGEDWTDVEIVLSSGTPAIGGRQPELMPWYIDFDAPSASLARQSFNMMPMADMAVEELAVSEQSMGAPKAAGKAQRTVAQQAQTSVEFILPAPVSVPSQEKEFVAEIINEELPAVYQHYSVRKLDREVFLLAKIDGWEKLNLLAGEAGIFLGNTYVGTTFIDPRRADDTLEVSLGRDSGVIVTRVKGRDFASRSFLGKNDKVTREWVITVRNTRQNAIDIRVLDQIPVSVNKSITVEAVDISGAKHDSATGELSWELTLQPGESVQKTVKYMVTYPGDRSVSLE